MGHPDRTIAETSVVEAVGGRGTKVDVPLVAGLGVFGSQIVGRDPVLGHDSHAAAATTGGVEHGGHPVPAAGLDPAVAGDSEVDIAARDTSSLALEISTA